MNSWNVLSLFAGIGGLELGLERAGMTTVGQVEIDPYCQRVLAKHWPDVPRHDDVRTTTDWWTSEPRPRVRVVCGGFPCQPVSEAGRGLAQQDARWLWPAMADVIAAVEPEWVIGENVPGLLTRGVELVVADLRSLGYRVRVGTISACAVGAPHARERVFVLAHSVRFGCREGRDQHSASWRRQAGPKIRKGRLGSVERSDWRPAEPGVGRVAHGVPATVDRIRALGNAVVPQVAEHVGRLIIAHDLAGAA
jgi:DNA (cytosine-5)-methyltransferase 1